MYDEKSEISSEDDDSTDETFMEPINFLNPNNDNFLSALVTLESMSLNTENKKLIDRIMDEFGLHTVDLTRLRAVHAALK